MKVMDSLSQLALNYEINFLLAWRAAFPEGTGGRDKLRAKVLAICKTVTLSYNNCVSELCRCTA